MNRKVAILGKGNVGSAIAKGLDGKPYDVRKVGNEPERVRETAAWGDIIVLAVPFDAVNPVVNEIGNAADGKTIIDVTNPLTADYQLAVGFTTSAAELLQAKAPKARVVKAFNYVFASHMSTGKLNDTALTLFVAGDDAVAKDETRQIGQHIGFDPVDAGPLTNARWLETLGYLNIQLGYMVKMGTDIGFALLR
jgi:predicted dinucleotide-binding enzyme